MKIKRRHLLLAAAFTAPQASAATADNPKSRVWTLDKINWQSEQHGGAKYAVLDGDRDKPGAPFTYAFWMPAGVWVPAHTHTQQAHVAVLKGELLLGYGSKMDKARTAAIPQGGFFIVRAGEPHFEGCKTETLIIGSALGGWKTVPLE